MRNLSPSPGPGSTPSPSPARWPVALAAVAGVLLVLLAGRLLLFSVPHALAERRDFASAPVCGAAAGAARECVRSLPATVDGKTVEKTPRSSRYWLTLTEDGGPSYRVETDGHTPVFDALSTGDTVTVTRWRGEVRAVGSGALRQHTVAAPALGHRFPAAFGLGLLGPAAGLLWSAYWYGRRSGDSRALRPWQITVPLMSALCLGLIGFAAPLLVDGLPAALVLAGCGALPVLAVTAWRIRHHRRGSTGTDTLEVAARVLTEEECVPGRIIGEVPYSVAGFDHLVTGPGLLAATPDPTGRVARRPVPRRLAAVRVRPPYRTDPSGAAGPRDQVIECLDGTVPVLIVAPAEHIPSILGALAG
ncbi:hypothetical protein [Streptomyces paludis]|uniref:Uncharacterized protein n=1 Tax=Streptomyces paludis TaxID=2282738 RepID=A0A345HII2_9ACTN|nr:hypothetical protein [Streptomyces paludis]AXG76506.1 hypothetical protein DVK44_01145 [Streptomyces paludis]